MKKKKKGSALVLVLIVFTILSILGIAISSLAVSTYKMRSLKANVKTGLYASEAGVDEAYGIIGNCVDFAIDKGNESVKIFMDELNGNEEEPGKLKKAIRAVKDKKNGVEPNEYDKYREIIKNYINEKELTIKQDAIKKDQNIKFRKAYVKTIEGEGEDKDASALISKLNYPKSDEDNSYKFELDNNKNEKLNIKASVDEKTGISNIDYDSKEPQKLLTINISSIFKHKGVEKQLKADYDIYVPSYEDTYYIEENHIRIAKNPVWTKAIAVDGDMNVNSDINVDGDIYVKGKEEDTKNHGININVSGIHRFNGQIAIGEDFNVLSNNSICNIEKRIFAKNLFLKESANSSRVNIKESLYTKDDLEINAAKSGVVINGGYYGLSDGRQSSTSNSSSSVNINAVESDGSLNCSLKIAGESIIMGTSYVNLINPQGGKYQTGESLSIKGNYRAYTQPLEGVPLDSKKNILTVKDKLGFQSYYKTKGENPNEEVDPFIEFVSKYEDDSLTAIDKSNYFKSYYDKYGENSGLKKIKIPKNSVHTGAIFIDDGVVSSTYSIDVEDEIKLKNNDFAQMVYNMGQPLGNKIDFPKKFLKTVESQLDSNVINKHINEDKEKGIYNCGEDATIILAKGNYELDPKIKKGIVIVDGNVNVNSEVNFTGTIIATGDINVKGNAQIKYDEDIVKTLVASRYDLFNGIFTNNSHEECDVQLDPRIGVAEGIKSSIKKDKLIKMKNWTILR